MMKILRILLILFLICGVSGCKQEINEPDVQDLAEESKQDEDINSQSKQKAFDEFSVLITANAINIRNTPDTTSKENIIGQVHMGESYTVFEENKNNEYTWYRIGEGEWIANDGSWCIEYDKDEKNDYPYVIGEEEVKELLSVIAEGSSCYTNDHNGEICYLNIYGDSDNEQYPLVRKILIGFSGPGITAGYPLKYSIGKIVKISDVTYDVYVSSELNYDRQDNSLGCIRISNIGIHIGDGGYSEHPYCDVTFMQNNNEATDECLKKLYGIETHFFCSHQVHI